MGHETQSLTYGKLIEQSASLGYRIPDLFDSMDSYFEDERHDEEAKVLMSMMKDEWEQNWRDDSVYDYLGNREKEAE